MTQRDEAMRAAAQYSYADPKRAGITPIATAGADAELARVVEWLRGLPSYRANRSVIDALAAHAHWPKESE